MKPPEVAALPPALTATGCAKRGAPVHPAWSGSKRLKVMVPVNRPEPPVSWAESLSATPPTDAVVGFGVVWSCGLAGAITTGSSAQRLLTETFLTAPALGPLGTVSPL